MLDIDAAVEGCIASKFRNSGQTCVCTNRLLVQANVYDAFLDKLAKRVGRVFRRRRLKIDLAAAE